MRKFLKSTLTWATEVVHAPAFLRARAAPHFLILTAHQFSAGGGGGPLGQQPVRVFREHIRRLKQQYRIVPLKHGLERLTEGPLDANLAAVTVDDGFCCAANVLAPMLLSESVSATIFVVSDFLDTGRIPWPTELRLIINAAGPRAARLNRKKLKHGLGRLRPLQREQELSTLAASLSVDRPTTPRPLTWDSARALMRAGISFGSHAASHCMLPFMDDDVLKDELVRSKSRIEEELHAPCDFVAYPDGAHDLRVRLATRAAGYRYGLTQDMGVNRPNGDHMAIKRLDVPWNETTTMLDLRAAWAARDE